MTVLTTSRLTLRPRVPDDAAALFAAMADPDVMRWWSHPPFASVDALRADFAERDGGGPWRAWAITRTGAAGAIGFVAAGIRRPGVAEVGYLIAKDATGQGIAREAVSAVIDHLIAQGCHRIFADTDPDNVGSIRLLARLGFTLEGRLREEWRTHIGLRDPLLYGLLAREWRGRAR